MEKKKLEQFKKKLEQRQQELRRTVSRNVQDGRAADSEDIAQDIADKAANSYTKEFLFSQSSNDRALLARVEEALVRLREGNFGACINCGDEVNAKRLEAVPWARYCIKCQEKIEQGQIQEAKP
jgi:DnaK suppressor protein